MIDLTPLEVRKKKGDFRRILRGYEPDAVDDFLDLVAERMEQLVREHAALSERVQRADQQVAEFREREKALTDALVTAQAMREEIRQQTAREADSLKRQAEQESESRVRQAHQEAESVQQKALLEAETAVQQAEQRSAQLRAEALQESAAARAAAEQEAAAARAAAEQESSVLRGAAEQEAQRLRAAAAREAEQLVARARQAREREEELLRRLHTREQQLVGALRSLLEREIDELNAYASAVDAADTSALLREAEATPAPAVLDELRTSAAGEARVTADSLPGVGQPAAEPVYPAQTPAPASAAPAPLVAFGTAAAAVTAGAAGSAAPPPPIARPEPSTSADAGVDGEWSPARASGPEAEAPESPKVAEQVPEGAEKPPRSTVDEPGATQDLGLEAVIADAAQGLAQVGLDDEADELEPFAPEPVYEEDLADLPNLSLTPREAPAAPTPPTGSQEPGAGAEAEGEDDEATRLLENAALAGYRIDLLDDEAEPGESELLLEEGPPEEGRDDDDWLSNMFEDER